MSGHVPKFGAPNEANFTEASTLARGGGKGGSGDSAASSQQEESGNGPVYSGRGSGRGGAPPKRVSAAPEPRDTGSVRSSQEGSVGNSRPSPPGRQPRDAAPARGGVRGSQDRSARSNPPRNVNEDYAGASHLPKFGEWNAGEGETNYTVMFQAAAKERKTGTTGDDTPMKGSGDSYRHSSRVPKKQSGSGCFGCFS